jgi:FAD dependent oxidoreductase TIGR03364
VAERERYDDAIVGAGILGLAHAYHLARRGRRVIVFERGERAQGASIRNFGMLWPIGQPAGARRDVALRSLAIWREVLSSAGIWHEPAGSLHLAYHEDEEQVLREFAAHAAETGYPVSLLTSAEVATRAPAVRVAGLRAALWSATETCVDPREVVAGLPGWLSGRFGVSFVWGAAVTGYDRPRVVAGGREWRANRLFVCGGDDLTTLFPEALAPAGLVRCKLQMMRTEPCAMGWRLGPMLAAGLTLRHYESFGVCSSLPALKARVASEMPEYDAFGIHVLVSQNGRGELVIGDSHEHGAAIAPFDREEIDALILRYLETFFVAPGLRIASRWHGTYVKHPSRPYWVARPAPGAVVVTGVGGAGMTLSFGLAELVVAEELG